MVNKLSGGVLGVFFVAGALCTLILAPSAQASIAYGSINNFDTVNDTGVECHGFEIEIDGAHSTDITYTYDWNHYGAPRITEDNSDPANPKVFVRYESGKNPDGTWAAYTAIPAGTIAATDGHQFTDPSVNFGGEHFGVGYYGNPTAVIYNWLIDNGSGSLIHGGAVNIATPTFTYVAPVNNVPAQVQAAIVPPPPPPQAVVLEFGPASWVKEIKTQTHNNNKVELRDLVSDDPDNPNDKNWKNGEPDEVEMEWRLFQTEFNKPGQGNGGLEGAPEELNNGDEIITRRYEFYKYIGPFDQETGEAMADSVGPDGIHGVGTKNINGADVDLSTVAIVGDYVGAQMAGFDAAGQIGLIDHVQDGDLNTPYVDRTLVVAGTPPITTQRTGDIPAGMTFDEVTGILAGTPQVSGVFNFSVHSTDSNAGDVTKSYTLTIKGPAVPEGEGEVIVNPEGEGEVVVNPEGEGEVIVNPEGESVSEGEGESVDSQEGENSELTEGESHSSEGEGEGEGEVPIDATFKFPGCGVSKDAIGTRSGDTLALFGCVVALTLLRRRAGATVPR